MPSLQPCERYAAERVEECFRIVQHIHVCVTFNNVDAMNASMIADAILAEKRELENQACSIRCFKSMQVNMDIGFSVSAAEEKLRGGSDEEAAMQVE